MFAIIVHRICKYFPTTCSYHSYYFQAPKKKAATKTKKTTKKPAAKKTAKKPAAKKTKKATAKEWVTDGLLLSWYFGTNSFLENAVCWNSLRIDAFYRELMLFLLLHNIIIGCRLQEQ